MLNTEALVYTPCLLDPEVCAIKLNIGNKKHEILQKHILDYNTQKKYYYA